MAIPLTLIGGYLGSGKTTLVNHLLSSPQPSRTAVVVNDFGEVNVDAVLIAATGADTIELTNGCICCQITDDVQRTMSALAARADIDHVVCEVSGIGDPSQLGSWRTFPGFRPGPIVICADALVTPRRLMDEFVSDVVHRQIASADIVLVTKTDLATAEQIEATTDACTRIAPKAATHRTTSADCAPSLDWLLRGAVSDSQEQAKEIAPHEPGIDHSEIHRTVTVSLSEGAHAQAVESVLKEHADELTRAKGFARDTNGRWAQIQLAGGTVSSAPLPTGTVTYPHTEIVLIAAGPHAEQTLTIAANKLHEIAQSNSSQPTRS